MLDDYDFSNAIKNPFANVLNKEFDIKEDEKQDLASATNTDAVNVDDNTYLTSIPGMEEKLLDGRNTPLSECVPADEVDW